MPLGSRAGYRRCVGGWLEKCLETGSELTFLSVFGLSEESWRVGEGRHSFESSELSLAWRVWCRGRLETGRRWVV